MHNVSSLALLKALRLYINALVQNRLNVSNAVRSTLIYRAFNLTGWIKFWVSKAQRQGTFMHPRLA